MVKNLLSTRIKEALCEHKSHLKSWGKNIRPNIKGPKVICGKLLNLFLGIEDRQRPRAEVSLK